MDKNKQNQVPQAHNGYKLNIRAFQNQITYLSFRRKLLWGSWLMDPLVLDFKFVSSSYCDKGFLHVWLWLDFQ